MIQKYLSVALTLVAVTECAFASNACDEKFNV